MSNKRKTVEQACIDFLVQWFSNKIPNLNEIELERIQSQIDLYLSARLSTKVKYSLLYTKNDVSKNSHEVNFLLKKYQELEKWLPLFFEILVDTRLENLIVYKETIDGELVPIYTIAHYRNTH